MASDIAVAIEKIAIKDFQQITRNELSNFVNILKKEIDNWMIRAGQETVFTNSVITQAKNTQIITDLANMSNDNFIKDMSSNQSVSKYIEDNINISLKALEKNEQMAKEGYEILARTADLIHGNSLEYHITIPFAGSYYTYQLTLDEFLNSLQLTNSFIIGTQPRGSSVLAINPFSQNILGRIKNIDEFALLNLQYGFNSTWQNIIKRQPIAKLSKTEFNYYSSLAQEIYSSIPGKEGKKLGGKGGRGIELFFGEQDMTQNQFIRRNGLSNHISLTELQEFVKDVNAFYRTGDYFYQMMAIQSKLYSADVSINTIMNGMRRLIILLDLLESQVLNKISNSVSDSISEDIDQKLVNDLINMVFA